MNRMLDAIHAETIKSAREGGKADISLLYEHYHPAIFRFLFYRLGDRQGAEDLTMEVFLRMIRFLPGYRLQGGSFEAWLFQIARNLAIDHFRSRQSRPHVQLSETIVAGDPAPDEAAEHLWNSENLRRALATIGDDQRDVIILRIILGIPIAQVAQALHKSEDSIKALQRRGLLALREVLTAWEIPYE